VTCRDQDHFALALLRMSDIEFHAMRTFGRGYSPGSTRRD